MKTNNFRVIGVMSGTSLDGIDLVDATFSYKADKWDYIIHNSKTIDYTNYWKERLSQLISLTKDQLKTIDEEYTSFLALVIKEFITNFKIEDLIAVCSHGHTALHDPEQKFTYQIGNLSNIASLIGEKVVCDFRVQDVQLGGQGAPLVPIGDKLLFKEFDFCLNLGGFANISFDQNNERIAYDICPVNIVMNHYVKQKGLDFDDEGKIAASGTINTKLLKQLNGLEFYKMHYPKSLGFEWVKSEIFPLINSFNLSIKDVLRTFVEHVAIQIINQINANENAKILITGGGVFNRFLIERLSNLTDNQIKIPPHNIINFKEALIFGFLGVLKLREETNCLSSVTGAKYDHSSGKIFLP